MIGGMCLKPEEMMFGHCLTLDTYFNNLLYFGSITVAITIRLSCPFELLQRQFPGAFWDVLLSTPPVGMLTVQLVRDPRTVGSISFLFFPESTLEVKKAS